MKPYLRFRSHRLAENEQAIQASEYARKMNYTVDAIRKQCRNRKLKSYRFKNRWYVIVPSNFSFFLLGLMTLPNLPELIAIVGLIIPLIIAFISLIQNLRIKDIELSAKIDVLVVKLDNYIQTKEIEKNDIRDFEETLKEIQDDIIKLKIISGIIPDRRDNKDD